MSKVLLSKPGSSKSGNSRWSWSLGRVLLLAAALRVLPALLLSVDAWDLHLYREMGEAFLRGGNVYTETRGLYPYTPVSLPIPGLLLAWSLALGWPFPVLMKIPAILGELGIVWMLFHMGNRDVGPSQGRGIRWALTYAVNPLGILVAGFQGNIMTLVALTCLAAYYFLERSGRIVPPARDQALSGLMLGLAIALRGFPVLIAPIFALRLRRTSWQRFLLLAALPSAVSLAPYMVMTPTEVVREVFAYDGSPALGWAAPIMVAGFIRGNVEGATNWLQAVSWVAKLAFLIAYLGLLVRCFVRNEEFSTLRASMTVWLLFYTIYVGVAPQYLVWLIPFAVVSEDRMLRPFLVEASVAVAGFFLFACPQIILGGYHQSTWIRPFVGSVMYVLGSMAAWIRGGVWAILNAQASAHGELTTHSRGLILPREAPVDGG